MFGEMNSGVGIAAAYFPILSRIYPAKYLDFHDKSKSLEMSLMGLPVWKRLLGPGLYPSRGAFCTYLSVMKRSVTQRADTS